MSISPYHQSKDRPHGNSKFTDEEVQQWCEMRKQHKTIKEISRITGVHVATIARRTNETL